jgi:hypothetical protein
MNFGYLLTFKTIDKGLIEQFGPTGVSSSILNVSFNMTAVQTGFIYHIVIALIYGFCFYFFIYYSVILGLLVTVSNIKFFLIIFGYLIFALNKTV